MPGLSRSPSMRREWIEIQFRRTNGKTSTSPSMRREWIEISDARDRVRNCNVSPSMRREWIEIKISPERSGSGLVSLHAEGVD